jgi:hypothetical protein
MGDSTLQVNFQVAGIQEIERAFGSILSSIEKLEKASARTTSSAAKDRIRTAQQEAAARMRHQDALSKLAQRVEKDQTKAAERGAKAREKADGAATKAAERNASAEAKAVQKSERDKTRAVEQESRRREGIVRRSSEAAGRLAKKLADEEIAAAKRAAAERTRVAKQLGGAAGRGAAGVMGGATRLAGAALALGGGFALADIAQATMGAETAAIQLANSAYTGDKKSARRDPKVLLQQARMVQNSTNIDKTDILRGMQQYIALSSDSSILDSGNNTATEMAELAKATGTDFTALATTAGNLRVQNKNLKGPEMMNLLRGIIGQGKLGAVEISDLVQHAGTITATSGQYGGDQAENQRKLLGLAQIARKVSDPAEAATAVNKLATDVSSHAAKMESAGVTVRDKDKNLIDPAQIIANLMEKTGGDVGQLQKLGIGERSMKLFNASKATYNEAYQAAKSTKKGTEADWRSAGADAVRHEIGTLENAGYSKEDVAGDLALVKSGTEEKFNAAMLRLKDVVADRLAPNLERFANKLVEDLPKLEKFISKLADMGEWLASNPYKGVAAIVGLSVAKEIASAGIGMGIEKALSTSIGQKIGAGGLIVGTAYLAVKMGMMYIDSVIEDKEARARKNKEVEINAANAGSALTAARGNFDEKNAKYMEAINENIANPSERTKKGVATARAELEAANADVEAKKKAADEAEKALKDQQVENAKRGTTEKIESGVLGVANKVENVSPGALGLVGSKMIEAGNENAKRDQQATSGLAEALQKLQTVVGTTSTQVENLGTSLKNVDPAKTLALGPGGKPAQAK